MQVIVIGGGIGGLSAALALRQVGMQATVYERARQPREVGAGLGLWPNALRVLSTLGVGGAVRGLSVPDEQGTLYNWRGDVLARMWSAESLRRHGAMMTVVHRADLLGVLLDAVGRTSLRLGAECVGFRQSDMGVIARFANGDEVRGDLLIGADGLHSAVRAQLFGATPPRYAGYTAWRGVAEFDHGQVMAGESWGRGQRFGMMPLNRGRVYWFGTANTAEGEADSPAGRKADVRQRFAGWHAPIEALIEATDGADILRNDIYDRSPLRYWAAGRVALLGDAAHPMTPNLAQGACQAIEDAGVLAKCLSADKDVPAALHSYEAWRMARTRAITSESRLLGQVAQWRSPVACWLRDTLLRRAPARLRTRQLQWIVDYRI
jgi:2-polyprenyl-6-methoxyphenol hydroxylase-like FAD-dependent oxidoreductase